MKWFIWIAVVFVLLFGSLFGYLMVGLPSVNPAPDLRVDQSVATVKRGEYLANAVAVCMDCHSARDWSKFSGPLAEGTLGKGGEAFTKAMGFPGDYYAPNLTPSHLGSWTDGEIYRAIVSGVDKDGEPLFPVMPYHAYGKMDESDIHAIISYLRSLPSIENDVAESSSPFPFNLILRTIPANPSHTARPEKAVTADYGSYMFNAAACMDCHTPVDDKGAPLPGMYLAGGREFPMPGGVVRSPNITSDVKTGIGAWTTEQFIARFKAFADSAASNQPVEPGSMQTVMPWTMYAHMDTTDLSAIFTYLQTVSGVENIVTRFTPKTN